MAEVRVDVEGIPVEGDPVADAYPDCGDLVLAPLSTSAALDPDADAPWAPYAE